MAPATASALVGISVLLLVLILLRLLLCSSASAPAIQCHARGCRATTRASMPICRLSFDAAV